jgi:DNA-directed RNA polymerase specialized sigma24 family protein
VSEHANLDEISTRWPMIQDPVQFVLRYAPAIQRYLGALLKAPHDAEEVAQEFLLRGLQRGFVRTTELRGRFRDYLKVSVRNAALTHLGRERPRGAGPAPEQLPAPDVQSEADREWLEQWRACLLDRAWQALDHHERQSPGSLAYTVLRLTVDHPDETSAALAERASALAGHAVRADAFRKQLSRARRQFAELLLVEVARTLEAPNPERVEEELCELGLMSYVRDYLPTNRRQHE